MANVSVNTNQNTIEGLKLNGSNTIHDIADVNARQAIESIQISLDENYEVTEGADTEMSPQIDDSFQTAIQKLNKTIDNDEAVLSQALNTINGKLDDIEDTIDEDERVTASALNDLNDRLLAFENGTATSNYATESYVDTQISNLVNGAPAALDTLKEIADMLDDDQSPAGGIIQQLETKANSTDVYNKTAADNKFATIENLEEDEEVINAALNDLNSRIEVFETGSSTSNYATESYVDTQISNLVDGAPITLDTLKEIADILDNDESATGGIIQQLANKANSADLATVATSGSYNDLTDKPNIPTVPTNVSSFTNDAGYLTQHQDISGKANSADVYTKTAADEKFATIEDLQEDEEVMAASLTDLNSRIEVFENGSASSNYATESYVTTQINNLVNGAPAALDTLKEIADMLDNDQSVSGGIIQQLSNKANSVDLATVATSGSYNDLTDKPNIPTVPTNVSSFTNDAGYLTQHQDISGKANSADVYTKTVADNKFATKQEVIDNEETVAEAISRMNDLLQSINTRLGNFTFVKLTQQQYNDLQTKDPDTLYIIND